MPGPPGRYLPVFETEGLEGELRRRMAAGDLVNGSITCSPGVTPGGRRRRTVHHLYLQDRLHHRRAGAERPGVENQIAQDRLFQAFARLPVAFETAFAHTRWASVGSITEENCHPLSNFTLPTAAPSAAVQEKHYPAYGTGPWTIHVVLNGDIDNYQTLREALEVGGELIAPEVTTDTKIIPLQIEKYLLARPRPHRMRSGAPSATSRGLTPSRW